MVGLKASLFLSFGIAFFRRMLSTLIWTCPPRKPDVPDSGTCGKVWDCMLIQHTLCFTLHHFPRGFCRQCTRILQFLCKSVFSYLTSAGPDRGATASYSIHVHLSNSMYSGPWHSDHTSA